MAEPNARDGKLIQYLNEAYGKEKELETALQGHIAMTTRPPYKKRLQEHLRETKAQSKGLERRIKALGGKAEAVHIPGPDVASSAALTVTSAASKVVSAAKGAAHAVRGTGEAEKMLKNAKTELFNEHEEIANYLAIEALADAVGDKETARLAKDFRRQEERMATFLTRLVSQLAKAVATEEIPAAERRRPRPAARRRATATRSRASAPAASRSKPSRSAGARAAGNGAPTTKRATTKRASAARASSARSK